MTKKSNRQAILIHWTKHVPSADVQDPLGTSLRGSTRIANRLLFCITSITPRARYYSFIPWCVYNHQNLVGGTHSLLGLREAIVIRERALTLGCVAYHDGAGCEGPGLVGKREAIRLLEGGVVNEVNLKKTRLAKSPALDAYYNSLVNLGLFTIEGNLPELDDDEEPVEKTFDDLELSSLGYDLAKSYDHAVGRLHAVSDAGSTKTLCKVSHLKSWGRRGGLCELAGPDAPDQELLRDIFFNRLELPGDAHADRRRSLLLMLHIAKQLNANGRPFNQESFAEAVYFGEVHEGREVYRVELPDKLMDIATRWRMFYFHYYMAVSLEGVFRWLVTHLRGFGLGGEQLDQLISLIATKSTKRDLESALSVKLPRAFVSLSLVELFQCAGVNISEPQCDAGSNFDKLVRSDHALSESALELIIRDQNFEDAATEWSVSVTLLLTVLYRFKKWENNKYGIWLASAANDSYLDLIPPLVLAAMERRFGDWWSVPIGEIASFVLQRFVVQQHQNMSYEKAASGARCLLQVDAGRVFGTGDYDKIGISNARFSRAVQILIDLRLLARGDSKEITVTSEGADFLADELQKEAVI